MNYYILQHNYDLNLLKSEEPLWIYGGLNLGKKMDAFPKVTLEFKSKKLPDCIPNVSNYPIFNQKIISILKEAGANDIQYFEVDVKNKGGQAINDDYKCLNILKVVDAIDFEYSKFVWSDIYEGQTKEDQFIMLVEYLKLDSSKFNNEPIFLLKKLESLLLVREDLAQSITDKRLSGLVFYLADGYGQ